MRYHGGSRTIVVRKVSEVPGIGPVTTVLSSLVVKYSPYSLIVVTASKKKMRAFLDFDEDTASFRQNQRATQLLTEPKGLQGKSLLKEKLTSEKESNEEAEGTDEDNDKES